MMTLTTKQTCLVCNGSGVAEYDKFFVDYVNGGWIDSTYGKCDECDGEGELHTLTAQSCLDALRAISEAEKILQDADIVDSKLDDIYGAIQEAHKGLCEYIKYYNYD
jgi:hypothetical protein